MTRVEQVRLAMMILNGCKSKPETVEETMALIEKIIKKLRLDS
jgi:PBP1b-binding outer membrane lipoprotein LpoB